MEHEINERPGESLDSAQPGEAESESHWDDAQLELAMLAAVTGPHAPLLTDELRLRGEAILQRLRISE